MKKRFAINGLSVIGLDKQLTKYGCIVVMYGERVNRTTDGLGFVKDHTLNGIRKLKIRSDNGFDNVPNNR